MRYIALDFQKSNRAYWQSAGIAILVISVGIIAFLFLKQQEMNAEINALNTEIAAIKRPEKIQNVSEDNPENENSNIQLKAAAQVVSRLNLPWPSLFNALESTRGDEVDLLAVTPNVQTGEVQIVGQAADLPSTFDYIDRLRTTLVFRKIELSDYQKTTNNGLATLRFTIVAKWLPDHE